MFAARRYGAELWVQLAAFAVVLVVAALILGPVYERVLNIAPSPKIIVTRREALERLAVLALFPVSLAVVLLIIRSGVGSPQVMVAFFYGVVLVDGVLFCAITRRWRGQDSHR